MSKFFMATVLLGIVLTFYKDYGHLSRQGSLRVCYWLFAAVPLVLIVLGAFGINPTSPVTAYSKLIMPFVKNTLGVHD